MTTATTAAERRSEVAAELADRTMYDLLGAEEGIRRVVARFYELMDTDDVFAPIRRMHQPDLGPMRQGLFEFLSGWLGGPPLFIQRTGSPCLTEAHAPFAIDEEARDLWVLCMARAMADAGVDLKYRELLEPAFQGIAEMMRNVR